MKLNKVPRWIGIVLLLNMAYAYSLETRWVRMPVNIRGEKLSCISAMPREPEMVFIGTDKGLYRSRDGGFAWQTVFICTDEKGINDIFTNGSKTLYISTKNGLYRSDDCGNNWRRVLKGNFSGQGDIQSILVGKRDQHIYVLARNTLYKSTDGGSVWKRILAQHIYENMDDSSSDDSLENPITLKRIIEDDKGNIYLSTNRGLLKSDNGGHSWKNYIEGALYTGNINSCLISAKDNETIYLATDDGVFIYNHKRKIWRNIYSGLESIRVKDLSFDSTREKFVWCITDKDVYRSYKTSEDMLRQCIDFGDEPTIHEVQQMAIAYAEVSPAKIKRWRRGAQYRAILPKVTFGMDQSASDTYEIYTNSSKSYYILGPRDYTEGWDLMFTWDLGDLIYNEHQTSIDVRGKLMVQLRDDLLNDVTRLYFERKKVQIVLHLYPPTKLEKVAERELRIQELTALIDALTGGGFSREMIKKDNSRHRNNLLSRNF